MFSQYYASDHDLDDVWQRCMSTCLRLCKLYHKQPTRMIESVANTIDRPTTQVCSVHHYTVIQKKSEPKCF